MHLDTLTLMAAGSFVSGISGVLVFGAWLRLRSERALAWWGAGLGASSLGIGLVTVGTVRLEEPLLAAGGLLTTFGPALIWAGARTFNRAKVFVLLLLAGPAANLAAGVIPALGGANEFPILVNFVTTTVYLLLSAMEFWRSRSEPLVARWPLMGLCLLHAVTYCAGIWSVMTGGLDLPAQPPPMTSIFGLIHFESMLFSLGAGVCMAVMVRERRELQFKHAAQIDAVTGLLNHGAFFSLAERLLARCQIEGRPFSLVLFDLDHFKSINDRNGHETGDRVLRLFGGIVERVVRAGDVVARIGGEEFAAALPGATADEATVIAERARHAYVEQSRVMFRDGRLATVSGGVASADGRAELKTLYQRADGALYLAKRSGRNRVERAEPNLPPVASVPVASDRVA